MSSRSTVRSRSAQFSSQIPSQAPAPDPVSTSAAFRASNPNHRAEIEELDLSQLLIDPEIQRDEQPTEIAAIAARFNPDALGVITVSARRETAGGRTFYAYYVIDGQQRTAGARLANYTNKINAVVHYELTKAEEAQLFQDLNFRRSVSTWSLFKSRRVAGEEQATAIWDMLHVLGIPVGPPKGFMGIAAADRIYNQKDGPARLRFALSVMREVYDRPGMVSNYDHRVIEGLAIVYAHYSQILDINSLKQKLMEASGGITGLLSAGKTYAEVHGIKTQLGIANVIVVYYNKGKHANAKRSTRLPEIKPARRVRADAEWLAGAAEELDSGAAD